jgi:hypothetical protein
MSKASHSSNKKRLKEFALLDKQRNQTQGRKGPNSGNAAPASSGAVRTKTAPTMQRKTGI